MTKNYMLFFCPIKTTVLVYWQFFAINRYVANRFLCWLENKFWIPFVVPTHNVLYGILFCFLGSKNVFGSTPDGVSLLVKAVIAVYAV